MPLVLTISEETESGHLYADRQGEVYEFPMIYRNKVRPGERFVHYRTRRLKGGRRRPQAYVGEGIVGDVRISPSNPDRLCCDLLSYRPFPKPVPFRDISGSYLEHGGTRRGYFQRGVRDIKASEYELIVRSGRAH
jgi:hypothetical protein